MSWQARFVRALLLSDGRTLETLREAAYVLASDRFSRITHGPPIEEAIERLMRASESGKAADIALRRIKWPSSYACGG